MVQAFQNMNSRAQHILRQLIDTYLATGEPVGSRTLSRLIETSLSPATIRNIMADLEEAGLLFAPHTSAGRLPTAAGLRFFVDTLLERRELTSDEQQTIQAHCDIKQHSTPHILDQATRALSGLSACAGFVLAPAISPTIKHIEFVPIGGARALVVMVDSDDQVENRVIALPLGLPPSALTQATNYLTARSTGKNLDDVKAQIHMELQAGKTELDEIAARVVTTGLAAWNEGHNQLILRGQAHLLNDVRAITDLERIQKLFGLLEQQETVLRLLEMAQSAQGVQIFIGSEHELFSGTGCSMVITGVPSIAGPNQNRSGANIMGAIGVIGPTRLNYGRIVPLVDYTAAVVAKLLG